MIHYNFWQNKGAKNIFKYNTIWGYTSTNDALLYMRELYQFSKENEEYGAKLLEHFKKAKWKLITDKNGEYNTANKGGFPVKIYQELDQTSWLWENASTKNDYGIFDFENKSV